MNRRGRRPLPGPARLAEPGVGKGDPPLEFEFILVLHRRGIGVPDFPEILDERRPRLPVREVAIEFDFLLGHQKACFLEERLEKRIGLTNLD